MHVYAETNTHYAETNTHMLRQ